MTTLHQTILVVGANGTVASEVARLLEHAGHTVRRGTSRAAGAGQVHLDLANRSGIDDALVGVDSVFAFAPPGFVNQDELLAPLFAAARATGVRKIVMMSAMGANADDNAPLRKAELALEQSGVAWNVIRPNWFMQNFHTFWLHGIVTANAIQLPTGNAKGSFIDARDIAAVAASLLQRSDLDNQAFDLTGSEALDHRDVAALLSRTLGRTIRYEEVTPEVMRGGLLAAGLPADYTEFLLMILHFFKLGYAERTTDAVERITGNKPRLFETYARDFRSAYPETATV